MLTRLRHLSGKPRRVRRHARLFGVLLLFCVAASCRPVNAVEPAAYLRLNQAGYLPGDTKKAVVMAAQSLRGDFQVVRADKQETVYQAAPRPLPPSAWGGGFSVYYELDFSTVTAPGTYLVRLSESGIASRPFPIGVYPRYQEDLLAFLRQQRCGYNPFLDAVCHQRDGRSFYGPMPDGTFVDASGGWHDAGDQLKYLITGSNATARLLLAYELARANFGDAVNALGQPRPNGIPDVLDEAKWGLDWIHKLHPAPGQLFHQVADDRDHRGFRLPEQDPADYGWGANSYRPVYFANGKPQGLNKWQSQATGLANVAGRSAAALALAARIWRRDLHDALFAEKCLQAARDLYAMGRRQEGYQQGNSYGAPYRYNEDTWADDMEWAAAELFKATRERHYLTEAQHYARLICATSWMQHDTAAHYRFYPFTNVGHFALYDLVDARTRAELAGYYRDGLEHIVQRGRTNPFAVGVPFIWCSNNLVVAFITQALLYEKMTGDPRYHEAMLAHRDWLLGRNPWGTSMFTRLPAGGEFPEDVHLPIVQILKKPVPGGLVDGPIAADTYRSLIGIHLNQPDEFALWQPEAVVYHDDVGDYATNEPTMDGTADAVLMMALWSRPATPVTFSYGGIIRGDPRSRRLALVFTGDEFAEGADAIIRALQRERVPASFFFTGRFYRNPAFRAVITRLKHAGHYLGAHSDQHLLYCSWEDRHKLLVSRADFRRDLANNLAALRAFGITPAQARFFLPPYEWYNDAISAWAAEMGLELVNFTPGTRSNADYTTPDLPNYRDSNTILRSITDYEARDPQGLNGFLLLLHIGVGPQRADKFYDHLPELLKWLTSKNYQLVRVDDLLAPRRP